MRDILHRDSQARHHAIPERPRRVGARVELGPRLCPALPEQGVASALADGGIVHQTFLCHTLFDLIVRLSASLCPRGRIRALDVCDVCSGPKAMVSSL